MNQARGREESYEMEEILIDLRKIRLIQAPLPSLSSQSGGRLQPPSEPARIRLLQSSSEPDVGVFWMFLYCIIPFWLLFGLLYCQIARHRRQLQRIRREQAAAIRAVAIAPLTDSDHGGRSGSTAGEPVQAFRRRRDTINFLLDYAGVQKTLTEENFTKPQDASQAREIADPSTTTSVYAGDSELSNLMRLGILLNSYWLDATRSFQMDSGKESQTMQEGSRTLPEPEARKQQTVVGGGGDDPMTCGRMLTDLSIRITNLPNRKPGQSLEVSNQCAICIEDYQAGDSITWSTNPQCEHAYHTSCIIDYLAHKAVEPRRSMSNDHPCPCCRNSFLTLDGA